SSPKDVRFLTVLQGADAGASPDAATLVHSTAGRAYDGAVVAGNAVLFAVDATTPAADLTVELPSGLQRVLVTGLEPGAEYAVTQDDVRLRISRGSGVRADAGGVLSIRPDHAASR